MVDIGRKGSDGIPINHQGIDYGLRRRPSRITSATVPGSVVLAAFFLIQYGILPPGSLQM